MPLYNYVSLVVFWHLCFTIRMNKNGTIQDMLRSFNSFMQGNRAIAEIQFADYIFPAFDQACIWFHSVLSYQWLSLCHSGWLLVHLNFKILCLLNLMILSLSQEVSFFPCDCWTIFSFFMIKSLFCWSFCKASFQLCCIFEPVYFQFNFLPNSLHMFCANLIHTSFLFRLSMKQLNSDIEVEMNLIVEVFFLSTFWIA